MLRVTVASFDDARECPLRNVLDRLGDKWSLLIFAVLEEEPKRFNEIKRLIGDISQRVLTQKLRQLERDGYLSRKVYPGKVSKVAYELTGLGRSALVPVMQLMQWSLEAHAQIRQSRAQYDSSQKEARARPQGREKTRAG